MDPGSLRERIAFDKRAVATDDGYGNTIGGWAEQFQRAAELKYMRGSEPVIAARLTGVQPSIFHVWYDSKTATVDENWRIRDARTGKLFNIRSIITDPNKEYIDFTCDAGVASG